MYLFGQNSENVLPRWFITNISTFLSLSEGSNSWKLYVAASKCSRNHIISAKYKALHHINYISFEKSPCANIHFACESKGVVNVPRSHFVKAFTALPLHS
jgi:hypothetical protein